ncbi:hypothetical protein [Pantoea sp.]|uniref:hypothetical protein n=1 Tax=Pantoea sp. TaxID=69393 RepID=UPI00289A12F5|nr:hypothetical protein [Pantoea sp.]
MVKLIFLLTGAQVLKARWPWLAIGGLLLIVLGLLIFKDIADDGLLSVPLDTLAIFLILEGLVQIAVAIIGGLRISQETLLKGLSFLFIAFLIFNLPSDNNDVSAILFGIAFFTDGLLRILSSVVLRGLRWHKRCLLGIAELLLSIVILSDWPFHHHIGVPLCFALMLLSSGITLMLMARQVWQLTAESSVTSLKLYHASGLRKWHGSHYRHPPFPDQPPELPLTVYVWTPVGSATVRNRYPLIDRYIAAVDQHGVISTGHAALAMPPACYISHYPLKEIERDASRFRAILRAGEDNDVAGRFLPSLQEEVANWCQPDQQVAFPGYNPAALRYFWQSYSADSTYNLTSRNCSSTVIQAVDVAVEGILARRPFAGLHLLADPNFWLLGLVRGRAEEMTWTPGLVLDYVRLLKRVIEPQHSGSWLRRIQSALRLRRRLWRQEIRVRRDAARRRME